MYHLSSHTKLFSYQDHQLLFSIALPLHPPDKYLHLSKFYTLPTAVLPRIGGKLSKYFLTMHIKPLAHQQAHSECTKKMPAISLINFLSFLIVTILDILCPPLRRYLCNHLRIPSASCHQTSRLTCIHTYNCIISLP